MERWRDPVGGGGADTLRETTEGGRPEHGLAQAFSEEPTPPTSLRLGVWPTSRLQFPTALPIHHTQPGASKSLVPEFPACLHSLGVGAPCTEANGK